MRLSFLHGSNDLYGASRVLAQDVAILKSMGHETTVALPEDGPLTGVLEDHGAHVKVEPLRVLRRVAGSASVRLPIALPAVCNEADLVVVWTIALAGYLPTLRLRRLPTICSVHEILQGRSGRALAFGTCMLADAVMVNSLATAQWLTRDFARCRPNVAYPLAPPYDPLPRNGSSSDALRLLLMGRVNGHKGHIESVHACLAARKARAAVELTLIGGSFPGQEHHLKELLETIENLPWVTYGGEVTDTRSFISECDVVLVPTTRPEPFGIVALEAWSAGRRIIASDQGGLLEATRLVEGVTVPASDVDSLGRAIVQAYNDPQMRTPPRADAPASELCTSVARERAWLSALGEATG